MNLLKKIGAIALLAAPSAVWAQATPDINAKLAALEAATKSAQSAGDNAWMLVSSALVLMMTAPGLALFYGGLVRRKNVLGTMERVLTGKADVKELLRNRPKPALPSRKAGIAARVSLDSEASGTATLVEIVAEDRPGLLYDLATAISTNGGNIEVVLIDTQAHKAIDVFYVTANGGKLNAEKQDAIREAVEKAAGVAGR